MPRISPLARNRTTRQRRLYALGELGGAVFAACKKHKATLVIAKLDRLSRNVHFLSG